MSKRRKDAGQVIVVVALCIVFLLGFVALGVDLGYLRYMKRQLQKAADAGALAGAVQLPGLCTANCLDVNTAVQNVVAENGFPSVTPVTSCSPTSTGNFTLIVNAPPCYVSNNPNNTTGHVEVVVSQVEPLMFAKILGISNSTVSARGEAGIGNAQSCIYLLNPTGNDLTINGNAGVLTACNILLNSSSSNAARINGATNVPPITKGGSLVNPYSNLPDPTVGGQSAPPYTCGTTNMAKISTTTTLQPGVYCSTTSNKAAIDINATGSTVTFAPGTYVIQGGGLNIESGSIVRGTGVTFFLTGDPYGAGSPTYPYAGVSVGATADAELYAPTSGPDKAVLFYQDPAVCTGGASCSTNTNTYGSTLVGGPNSIFQGALVFPTTSLIYGGNANAQYTIIVAWTMTNSGNFSINDNYSSIGGSPTKAAVLGE